MWQREYDLSELHLLFINEVLLVMISLFLT